jgi:nicotinamide phosphoribosyltransferase
MTIKSFSRKLQNLVLSVFAKRTDREDGGEMARNIILDVDLYKVYNAEGYVDGVKGLTRSYMEARIGRDKKIPYVSFGWSMWAQKIVKTLKVTQANLDEAIEYMQMNGTPMTAERLQYWQNLIDNGGYPPIKIAVIPEGLNVGTDVPMMYIEAHGEHSFWCQYLEDELVRAWYACEQATKAYLYREAANRFWDISVGNRNTVVYAMNDFGLRGASSYETAVNGGVPILAFFRGSDNIPAIRGAHYYYGEMATNELAAYGAKAQEHGAALSFVNDKEYIITIIRRWMWKNGVISLVADGRDYTEFLNIFCMDPDVRVAIDEALAMNCRIVVRPDSNDMYENVRNACEMLFKHFGFVTNEKGYRTCAKNLGVIQGDGITLTTFNNLYGMLLTNGIAADMLVTGSGGDLLQNSARDNYRVAQKLCAMENNGVMMSIAKLTPGKKSKEGLVSTYLKSNGDYGAYDQLKPLPADFGKDMMVVLLDFSKKPGKILYTPTFPEIRTNTGMW